MKDPKTLEDMLIKTAKYLQFFAYNQNDAAFMNSFNSHFSRLRVNGYNYEVDQLSPNQYMVQITWEPNGVSRPEIISFPQSGGKYL